VRPWKTLFNDSTKTQGKSGFVLTKQKSNKAFPVVAEMLCCLQIVTLTRRSRFAKGA
jgi:hypothetical protein